MHLCVHLCSGRSDRQERVLSVERSYVGELAHCIGFDSDVVLLELLFDLIDACGDVLGLRAHKGKDKQQTQDQIRWSDIRRGRLLPSTRNNIKKSLSVNRS